MVTWLAKRARDVHWGVLLVVLLALMYVVALVGGALFAGAWSVLFGWLPGVDGFLMS